MYFGTSIGIAIRGNALDVVCLRTRGMGITVAGALRIDDFLARPAHEIAKQYEQFRKEHNASFTSAVVALPRSAGLVRTLELPPEVAPNLAQSVGYQVDSLHPFEEGAVYYDYSVLAAPADAHEEAGERRSENGASRLRVAVALAEKSSLDTLYERFRDVGIDVSAFTFSTAVLYEALIASARRRPLLLFDRAVPATEVLGIAADGSFYSHEVPAGAPLEREAEFCAAELRWKDGETPALLWAGEPESAEIAIGERSRLEEGHLSPLPQSPTGFYLAERLVAYAAALSGLELRLPGLGPAPGLHWNLLPAEKRVSRSHWAQTAAYALAALVVLLAVVWGTTGLVQDRLYAAAVNRQVQTLAPRVQYLDKLETHQKQMLQKLEIIQNERDDVTHKLDAVQELTRLLPPTAWVQSLQFTEKQVAFSGVAESASGILQSLNQSSYFQQPEFVAPISKNQEGKEVFQIRARLRDVPLMVPAPPAASPVASAPAATPAQPAAVPAAPPAAVPGAARAPLTSPASGDTIGRIK